MSPRPVRRRNAVAVSRSAPWVAGVIAGGLGLCLFPFAWAAGENCTTNHLCTNTQCPSPCSAVLSIFWVGLATMASTAGASFVLVRSFSKGRLVYVAQALIFLLFVAWLLWAGFS